MALIICPECGKEISDKSSICVHCGFPIKEYVDEKSKDMNEGKQKCPICGHMNNDEDDYCIECGNRLTEYTAPVTKAEPNNTKKKAKKKKRGCSTKFIIFIVFLLIFSIFGGDEETDNKSGSQSETGQESNVQNEEVDFVTALSKKTSEKIAKKADKILKEEIGFSEIKFIGKNEVGDSNWDIEADGYSVILTASDDVYRIFIPDSSIVFYEDEKVVMTKKELKDKSIGQTERNAYYQMAQEIIRGSLKNPKSADFPSIVTHPEEIAMQKNGDIIAVQSYVDATNSFGAEVRSKWTVQYKVVDLKNYMYEVIFINLDGESSGKFIDMD